MLKTKILRSVMAGVLAVTLVSSVGCYGPFKMTKALYDWNGSVSENKWAQEGVFLVMTFIPVYQFVAGIGDALVCNSIEFWTGTNPMDGGGGEAEGGADGGSEFVPFAFAQ